MPTDGESLQEIVINFAEEHCDQPRATPAPVSDDIENQLAEVSSVCDILDGQLRWVRACLLVTLGKCRLTDELGSLREQCLRVGDVVNKRIYPEDYDADT